MKRRSSPLKVMGLLHEIKGPNGRLFYNPANLNGEARVLLVLKFENGDEGELYCSPAVSKNLREKKMSTAQLLSMPVIEVETFNRKDRNGNEIPDSAEIIYTVTLPGAEWKEMTDVAPEAWTSGEYENLIEL
jgi:hypothetical protein